MNVQERDQLLQFFSSLQRTPAQPRDPVAEELIRQALSEGITPYALVQRAMGLGLALEAAQARLAQLEARCQAQAAQLEQARAAAPLPAHGAALPSQAQPSPANASVWGQGLLRQAAGTAVGVAAGVMAGGLLLEGWQRLMGEGAASLGAADGLADAGSDLWSISDDWT
jgi:hypothetical protein